MLLRGKLLKRKIELTTIIALALSNQLAFAGPVTDTYATGDTLTAAKMDNIKAAVNDNDSRITNIVTNTDTRFSGDGSDGNLTISSDLDWNATPPTGIYFDNVTIDAAQNFSVPAGTTIRCSGTFTNNGTITVLEGAEADGSASGLSVNGGPPISLTSVAHPGDTTGTASLGDSNNDHEGNPTLLLGGKPGKGIPQAIAISSFSNFRIGGGSGAGYNNMGNAGGGLLKVYCNGAIVNNGTINALGADGFNDAIGGGGGGIVILGSRTSIDNSTGFINVSGGHGADAGSFGGNGGGGGGGIIILVSPTAPILGSETVAAGTGGSNISIRSVTNTSRTAGAGGGGSGGKGGNGGQISSLSTPIAGGNGSDGYVISLAKDPSMMIH